MKKDDIINLSLQLFLENGYEKSESVKRWHVPPFFSKEDIFNAAAKKALIEEQQLFKKAANKCNSLGEKLVLLFMNTSLSSKLFEKF